jgi:hypothetical protein
MPEFKIIARDGKSYKLTAGSIAMAKQKAIDRGVDVARVEPHGPLEGEGVGVAVAGDPAPPSGAETAETIVLAIDTVGQAVRQTHATLVQRQAWYDDKRAVYRVIRNAAFTALLMFLIGLVAIIFAWMVFIAPVLSGR